MSFYAQMTGEIVYPDERSFNTVLNRLVDGGWIENSRFIDECENPIEDEPSIDVANRIIRIPRFYHRNLARVNFFPSGKEKGWLIGSSTDGVFVGWVVEDGVETNYDLEIWAKDNGLGNPPEDWQSLAEWQSMIEDEFISDVCP